MSFYHNHNAIISLIGIVLLIVIHIETIRSSRVVDYASSELDEKSMVELRAVFINCEIQEGQSSSDIDASRFQREELFKHNALRDCNKKLAIALKISSEPDQTADEYIPIDHVTDGINKRRVRLLNPYVLRLRWETPLQAYRLRRIETVSGILTKSDEHLFEVMEKNQNNNRVRRDVLRFLESDKLSKKLVSPTFTLGQHTPHVATSASEKKFKDCARREIFLKPSSNKSLTRSKRKERNVIMINPKNNDEISWVSNVNGAESRQITSSELSQNSFKYLSHDNEAPKMWGSTEIAFDHTLPVNKERHSNKNSNRPHSNIHYDIEKNYMNSGNTFKKTEFPIRSGKQSVTPEHKVFNNFNSQQLKNTFNNFDFGKKEFTLYEIGSPDIWCTVHVQLFEKMNTPDGKTVWNDLTKGEIVSINTMNPEWDGLDVNVRYRPAEWTSKEAFDLPNTSKLCLLVPWSEEEDTYKHGRKANDAECIIVPLEDIVTMDNIDGKEAVNKRNGNTSESFTSSNERHRRVLVRVSRAMLGSSEDNLNIASAGANYFLTFPHRQPYHVQIDLESKADENQLIIPGSSGRIATAVSDNARRTRTVLTVQATNTGLTAARFRIKARDCGPELSGLMSERGDVDGIATDPLLLPPKQTRRVNLELPIEVPANIAHCSVALVNDDGESVAVRDVTIKKGDRCYCVWHCDCVCFGDDPKLLCREMPLSRQAAAGLSTHKNSRRTRSVCYPNDQCLNILVLIIGVLMVLLFCGFVKACLGLAFRCVGFWGLDKLLQTPRKLSSYYEPSLSDRPVVYDDAGWPVHPDTKKRTVRIISWPMEFILNMIFFIAIPSVLVVDSIKEICARCKNALEKDNSSGPNKNTKNCFSTVDMQGLEPRLRWRRGQLRRWMTKEAEDLSTNIWQEGLTPREIDKTDLMRPLLREEYRAKLEETHSSCLDSEQDDTEYVLMQMQKSRESLARIQRKSNDSTCPTTQTNQNASQVQRTYNR